MTTTPENALTTGPSSGGPAPTPLWVWLLVLALAVLAIYGGYTAVSNYQRYYDTETARQAIAVDKDRLEANVTDLKQQVEQANKAKADVETALKQSRADTQTAVRPGRRPARAARRRTEQDQVVGGERGCRRGQSQAGRRRQGGARERGRELEGQAQRDPDQARPDPVGPDQRAKAEQDGALGYLPKRRAKAQPRSLQSVRLCTFAARGAHRPIVSTL